MSSLSAPKTPSVTPYTTVAGQQTQANVAAGQGTQQLNSTNQSTPFNNLSYTFDPATGQYTATNQYSPEQQQLLNILQGTQTQAGQQGQNLLSGAGYGSGQPNISGAADSQTEQLIAQQMQQLRPEQDYQTQLLDTKLRNQGLVPGDESYDQQTRQFNNTLENANASNAAQFENQAYGQALQNYQLPAMMAQELAQFGAPQSATGNLWNTPTAQIQPADYTGAYNAQNTAAMNAYKAQSDQYSGLLKGMFGIASAPLGNSGFMNGIFGNGSMGAAG